MDKIKVSIENLRFRDGHIIGDLKCTAYYIFIDNYIFERGDTVIDNGKECFIMMDSDKLFDIYDLIV